MPRYAYIIDDCAYKTHRLVIEAASEEEARNAAERWASMDEADRERNLSAQAIVDYSIVDYLIAYSITYSIADWGEVPPDEEGKSAPADESRPTLRRSGHSGG